jgi:hypothetical protein
LRLRWGGCEGSSRCVWVSEWVSNLCKQYCYKKYTAPSQRRSEGAEEGTVTSWGRASELGLNIRRDPSGVSKQAAQCDPSAAPEAPEFRQTRRSTATTGAVVGPLPLHLTPLCCFHVVQCAACTWGVIQSWPYEK